MKQESEHSSLTFTKSVMVWSPCWPYFQLQYSMMAPPSDAETKLNASAQLQTYPVPISNGIKTISVFRRIEINIVSTNCTLPFKRVTDKKENSPSAAHEAEPCSRTGHDDRRDRIIFALTKLQFWLMVPPVYRRWKFRGKRTRRLNPITLELLKWIWSNLVWIGHETAHKPWQFHKNRIKDSPLWGAGK